ncbi:MAG: dTDP-4-dehydrorhamnose reductase [Acidimicrobiales bacterium]
MAAPEAGALMRVFITGASGQLGSDLVRACEIAGDDVIACDRAQFDLTNRDAVYQAILGTAPDTVLHAGAWTAVDACEADAERAFLTNAMATEWVADASRRIGAHLVAVSTDYVFDGTKDSAYAEWDRPNPQSVYGRSKWAGEQAVAVHAPGSAIVRTAWLCGEHGQNIVKTVLGLLDHPGLAFVDDQRGCPSFTFDVAPMIRRLAVERRAGVHHVTNQGETTWYGFVRDILALAGHDPDKVRPIATADLDPPRPAPRPSNSVLDNAALRLGGVPLLPHYRESLERLLQDLDHR